MASFRRTVTKRDGRYRARWFDPATRKWSSATFARKTEANAWLDAQIAARRGDVAEPTPESRDMTFAAYCEEVFWPRETTAPATRAQQESLFVKHLLPEWGEVTLGAITRERVEKWRVRLFEMTKPNGEPYAHPTLRQIWFLFHKIIGDALDMGYMARTPFSARTRIKQASPSKPKRFLEDWEVEALARAIEPRYSALIYAMAYGGFRPAEALALRVDDLDFDHCEISVDESVIEVEGSITISGDLKRPRSHRSVPMPKTIMGILGLHVRDHTDGERDDLLFPRADGGPMYLSNFRVREFARAVKAAGIERLTPHDLRHTAASTWFDEGFDVVEVARMLGDSVAVAESTYIHLYKGRRSEKMTRLDDRFNRGRSAKAPRRRRVQ